MLLYVLWTTKQKKNGEIIYPNAEEATKNCSCYGHERAPYKKKLNKKTRDIMSR